MPLCSDVGVEARVPREFRPFRSINKIPLASFKAGDFPPALCYDAATDELFVAAPPNRTVHVLSPATADSRLRPVYKAPAPAEPSSVCLVRHTGTLVIAYLPNENRRGILQFSLVALSRNAQLKWQQQSELDVNVNMGDYVCWGSTLCECDSSGSAVLFGAHWSKQLVVVKLSPAHRLTQLRELQTPEAYLNVSAAVVNARTIVALSLRTHVVTINRLLDDRLEEISQMGIDLLWGVVLWSGEHLLLAEWTGDAEGRCTRFIKSPRIVELGASRTPLARASELLRDEEVYLTTWCAGGERVFVWDTKSNNILVYSVC